MSVRCNRRGSYSAFFKIKHIERIRQGAPGFMVIVHAVDEIARPRKIKDYNPAVLVPIGELRDDLNGHEGEWWGECLPGISATGTVQSASNSKTGACANAPPNVYSKSFDDG